MHKISIAPRLRRKALFSGMGSDLVTFCTRVERLTNMAMKVCNFEYIFSVVIFEKKIMKFFSGMLYNLMGPFQQYSTCWYAFFALFMA